MLATKLGLLLCHIKALPLCCWRNSLDRIRFYSWTQYLKMFFIVEHLKVPVHYQNLKVITDVYNLVKNSNISSIFQLLNLLHDNRTFIVFPVSNIKIGYTPLHLESRIIPLFSKVIISVCLDHLIKNSKWKC